MYYYYHPFLGSVFPVYLPGEARVGNQTADFRGMYDYYPPFWGPVFPIYLPGEARGNNVEIQVRTAQTMFMGTLDIDQPGPGPLVVKGTISDVDEKESLPATVLLEGGLGLRLQRINGTDWALMYDNMETGYQIKDYVVKQHNGGAYQQHTGTFIDSKGNKSDFFVRTDPVPPFVILTLICAASCVIQTTISEMLANSNEILKTAIEACVKRGGLPKIKVTHGFHMNVDIPNKKFEFGCAPDYELECIPKPIA